MAEPLWQPDTERVKRAHLTAFMDRVRESGAEVGDFADLYRWSVDYPERFWQAMWDFGDIKALQAADRVVEDMDQMPGARWFPGARLNFAENLLRFHDDHPAIVFYGEDGRESSLSYDQINDAVARLAARLRNLGIEPGDRVAGYLPNLPETIIAMLATTSIGAIWSSCSPDFGVNGVVDRFGQIAPRVLFSVDGYLYNCKHIDIRERVASVVDEIGSIEKVVIVPFLEDAPDLAGIRDAINYRDFAAGEEYPSLTFEQLPFDHPVYIMYSSGTTGKPKCIVHGAGGTLIQHLKELMLHTDLHREDRIFYFTTCGWMMWNWLASSLAVGATVVLYDGSPFYPDGNAMFDLVDRADITVFGTSAKFIAAAEKGGISPKDSHQLKTLRTILSTGSPLVPESFDYVYRDVKKDLCLSSISGGTDIVSCFALGNPIGPVWRGELQTRGLGMKVEILDENRKAVRGEMGELCCMQPFPSMPVGFWNDEDNAKYHAAYFERFPGIWAHGDYAMLTEHDGLVITGRSDATLNPGGVRIGTAEIYRQVEKLDEVLESIAVGQDWDDDVRVVLFVKLRDDATLDDDLRDRIRKIIRKNCTPRHVPAKIEAVPDIPRTISGKIVELAVRNVIHNQPVKNVDALANPETLDHYKDIQSLKED